MSAFDAGSIASRIVLDTSSMTSGVDTSVGDATRFEQAIAQHMDAPLKQLEAAIAQASSQVSGNAAQMGDSIEHGMMAGQAAMQLFPPLVVELLTDPLMGFVAAAMEGLAKVADAIGDVANHFRQVDLGSIKSGLDPATFSTFAAAAKASGVEVGTFSTGLELLQQRAQGAIDGDEAAAKGFNDLGISARQLSTLLNDPKEMLLTVADAMKSLDTPGERVQAAMAAMGRGGKEMLPFLIQGRDGITAMADSLGDLGARVDSDEAELGKTWATMGAEFSAMWEGLETALAKPVLQYLQDHINEIMPAITSLAKTLGEGVGGAMQEIIPFAKTVWGLMQSLGDAVGSIVVPAFEILKPVLEAIGWAMRVIADTAATALGGLATVIDVATGQDPSAAISRSEKAANRLAGDFSIGDPESLPEPPKYHEEPSSSSSSSRRKTTSGWKSYERAKTGRGRSSGGSRRGGGTRSGARSLAANSTGSGGGGGGGYALSAPAPISEQAADFLAPAMQQIVTVLANLDQQVQRLVDIGNNVLSLLQNAVPEIAAFFQSLSPIVSIFSPVAAGSGGGFAAAGPSSPGAQTGGNSPAASVAINGVQIHVNVEQASRQLAERLAPHIAEASDKYRQQMASEATAMRVRRQIGGKS